jgi:hypothetical protein
MIASLAIAEDDFAANLVGGQVIGLVPLRMISTRYVIAFAPTGSAADAIVQLLRAGRH